MSSVASPSEIDQHVQSIQTEMHGHIPTEAIACFVKMAQAGRDVYAYGNPWSHNVWLEETRFEAADIRNLWPIATIENDRPYLIPPQAFIEWLQGVVCTNNSAWSARQYLTMYLRCRGKGSWEFFGCVAVDPNDHHIQIQLTPFERAFVSDVECTPTELANFAQSILATLARQGFIG